MSKKLLWAGAVILVLGILVLAFYSLFEIYEDDKPFPPSRVAQVNEYLALDRWLAAEGHPVRIISAGSTYTLKSAAEGTILIQSDLFDWNDEAVEFLDSWVQKGGDLVLCLTFSRTWNVDHEPGAFLQRLGIESGGEQGTYSYDSSFPVFSRNVHFKKPTDEDAFFLMDGHGLIRLIQIPHGRGKITVLGRPRFMSTQYLKNETNARLSWFLFAGEDRPKEPGVLFIRGYARPQGLMGRVFQQGNFIIIIISAVALIVAGFWSVIPVFGLIRGNPEIPGKTLAERFLAEGRFLKRYKSLDHYKAVYAKEIRRRLMKNGTITGIPAEDAGRASAPDDEFVRQASALLGPGQAALAEDALTPGPQGSKNFLESVVILKKILERL